MIVPIGMLSFPIYRMLLKHHNRYCNQRKSTMISKLRSRIVFGSFVIIASAFSSGCAGGRQPMAAVDLDYFQIDCSIKEHQIKFLQSMRVNQDERLVAGASNALQPWSYITDQQAYAQRYQIHNNRTNWLINQKLMRLAHDCP